MSKFDPPWPRFAIRCSHKDGRESWFTDDEQVQAVGDQMPREE